MRSAVNLRRLALLTSVCAVVGLVMVTTSSVAAKPGKPHSHGDLEALRPVTVGPNGETPTPAADLELSEAELARARAGNYKAAMAWRANQLFEQAMTAGAEAAFDEAGVEVVSVTHPASTPPVHPDVDISSVLARDPDIVIAQPGNATAAATSLRPAIDAGVKLSLLSVIPDGYVFGADYAGMVTDDFAGMGIAAAELLGEALHGHGKIGFIYHDANFWITNQRDQAFKTWLTAKYPGIEIVTERGFSVNAATNALTNEILAEHPDIDGLYVPWASPAEGVLTALQSAQREDIAVVTMDLRTTMSLPLAQGRNVVGLASDEAYALGRALALQGIRAAIGSPTVPFATVPAFKVTRDNIVEAYARAISSTPPPEVMAVLIPSVIEHPASATVKLGRKATFTAAASGYPKPAVRWQYQRPGGSWRDLRGAKRNALDVQATPSNDGTSYRAVFVNKHGEAVSNAATLTVQRHVRAGR
jgi:ribose transport system substrate-binding protein